MAEKSPRDVAYLEFMFPALFVFFVIYGVPPILSFAAQIWGGEITCLQPSAESPIESPPASGTGPPVAGEGGETG